MINDEWTLIDSLGYENVVNNLVKTIKNVQPPFSLGIYGGWGSGKTSLMKQVYYRVGGKTKSYLFPFSSESENEEINKENKIIIDGLTPDLDYEAIWFNPWKHEMESNPLLGLLHEVRDHFDLFTKTGDEAKKLSDVSIRTGLDILTNTIKAITDIDFSMSNIETHGVKYETKNFETKSNGMLPIL